MHNGARDFRYPMSTVRLARPALFPPRTDDLPRVSHQIVVDETCGVPSFAGMEGGNATRFDLTGRHHSRPCGHGSNEVWRPRSGNQSMIPQPNTERPQTSNSRAGTGNASRKASIEALAHDLVLLSYENALAEHTTAWLSHLPRAHGSDVDPRPAPAASHAGIRQW